MITSFEPKMKFIDLKSFLLYVGNRIHQKVLSLISQSKNTNGESYMAYSPEYSKKTGKQVVDLKVSGLLISQIKLKITDRRFIINVVGGRSDVAEYLNKHKNWSFLDWGTELEKEYQTAVNDFFQNLTF